MLEINIDRSDEVFSVEECADGDFHSIDAALQLEDFNFVGESFFVGFEHANDVFAVFFFTDEQAAFYVLRFSAGLDYIAIGIFLDELDGGIERVEVFVGNDVHAGILQFFLAEGAIVFKSVGVGRAADNRFASGTQGLRFGALSESVVEDDDVGPLGVLLPVGGLGDKPVGDVAFAFRFDVITNFVTFFENFPSDIADESRDGNKEKFSFVHCGCEGSETVVMSGFANTNPETLLPSGMVRRIWRSDVTKCSKKGLSCEAGKQPELKIGSLSYKEP